MVDWARQHWLEVVLLVSFIWVAVRLHSVSQSMSTVATAAARLTGAAGDIEKLVSDSDAIKRDIKQSADELNRLVGRAALQDLTQGHISGIYAMAALILGLTFGLSSSWVIDGGGFLPSLATCVDRVTRGSGIVALAVFASIAVGFVFGPRLERRMGTAAKTGSGRFYRWVYRPLRSMGGE